IWYSEKYRDRDLRSLIKKNPTEKGGVRHQSEAPLSTAGLYFIYRLSITNPKASNPNYFSSN
ncbi:hypothetical protein, partial [Vibrio hyugaensis]|uniref:hypothetical protein n=1 Tax=Vibrio hyugaensis TaxID=1534743 RepID=UPI001CA4E0DB